MRTYLYDLDNCIIYKKPLWTSESAIFQLCLTLNESGGCFGTWTEGLREGKKRGNAIADGISNKLIDYACQRGFKEKDFA